MHVAPSVEQQNRYWVAMERKEDLCREALVRILGAIYLDGDQRLSSFLYGNPGAPLWQRRMGVDIFVKEHAYIEALLFLRRNGSPFLRDISVQSLWSKTTSFVTENFAYIAAARLTFSKDVSLAQQISDQGLETMSLALQESQLFSPERTVTLYPLVPVVVHEAFNADHISLTGPDGLSDSLQHLGIRPPRLQPALFPPVPGLSGAPQPIVSWLCISAADPLIARKRASATLGALALTPIRRERYLQTGRTVQNGFCTISDEGVSCSPSAAPMTPRLASDICITNADHAWLRRLTDLMESPDRTQKSKVRALEYFYRAWFDDERERFPTLCMSLDSLVSAQHRHTRAAVDFVLSTVPEAIDQDRLRLLMRLRGAVVHGAAPDVYESEHYEAYYAKYAEDPICDLDLIVASCLRHNIFKGELSAHPDPHSEIVRKQQALGNLPKDMRGRTIIADD